MQAKQIVGRIHAPRIPNRSVNVTRYGAKGDGVSLNSRAFAMAIGDLAARGGGRLVVPSGRFLTGPIELQSNIELHVTAGATLAFSTDPADFPIVLRGSKASR